MANLAIGAATGPGVHVDLVLHTATAPTWFEWQPYLDQIRERCEASGWDIRGLGTLVVTDGGGPNTEQRTAASRLLAHLEAQGGDPPRVAVVTDSLPLRTMLRALGVFNPRMRAFAPAEFAAAVEFVGLAQGRAREVLATFEDLERAKLGGEGRVKALRTIRAALAR